MGTLNNLYTSAQGDDAKYDLMGSLKDAVMSIPENLMGLNFSDPLGIEVGDLSDSASVAQDQEVDASIFGNLNNHFVTGYAAFSYLIFILLYTPCVAAMGLMCVSLVRDMRALLRCGRWGWLTHPQRCLTRLLTLVNRQSPVPAGLAVFYWCVHWFTACLNGLDVNSNVLRYRWHDFD